MPRSALGSRLKTRLKPDLSIRRELIQIQKTMVENLKREITLSLGKETKEFRQYLDEYNQLFKRGYRRRSSMDELVHRVSKANIVYNGDYHTMAQAQRIPLRILRRVLPHRPQITLAVEVVRVEHQRHLDKFLDGRISEEDFLKAIDYDRTWGFPWEHYRDLFLFARDNHLRVLAINTDQRGRWKLKKRDIAAARVIAREHLTKPENLIYVFDGDLHIAPSHLPQQVESLLARFNVRPRRVIIYQNNEDIYWQLAQKGIEQETDVVLVGSNQFCVLTTPPIIKFQSYFNWIENTKELSSPPAPNWRGELIGEEDLYTQVLNLVKMITGFLEIDVDGLEDFIVYSPADLDFLKGFSSLGDLTQEEIETITIHMRSNESCFIERRNIIYIANLSINHAAEEAAHFIHRVCAGPRKKDLSQVEDFYCRVMREALGFLGSKIVNHKRPCYTLEDFKNLRRRFPGKTPERIEELKNIGKLSSRHKKLEERYLKTGKLWKLEGPIYEAPLKIHIGVTHSLGYMLGDRLFRALIQGLIEKSSVRRLFFMNFSDLNQSLNTYLELIRTLKELGIE